MCGRSETSRTVRDPGRNRADETNRLGIEAIEPGPAAEPGRGRDQREQPAAGQVSDYTGSQELTTARLGRRQHLGPQSSARRESGSARRANGTTGRRDARNGPTRTMRNRDALVGPTRTQRIRDALGRLGTVRIGRTRLPVEPALPGRKGPAETRTERRGRTRRVT